MADYTAAYLPGNQVPCNAASSIAGGDPVEVAGSGTVRKCTVAASPSYLGIAAFDCTAGARVGVIAASPVHDGIAEGAITAGDQLCASTATGKTVKTIATTASQDVGASPTQTSINTAVNAVLAASNGNRGFMGIAMTSAADGGTVRWMQK